MDFTKVRTISQAVEAAFELIAVCFLSREP
jgi:hypothetical protein